MSDVTNPRGAMMMTKAMAQLSAAQLVTATATQDKGAKRHSG